MPNNADSSEFAPRLHENDIFDEIFALSAQRPDKQALPAVTMAKTPPYSPSSDAHHHKSASAKSDHRPLGRPPSNSCEVQDGDTPALLNCVVPCKVVQSCAEIGRAHV